jgi:mono/diheme cytochrome c family protein
MRSGLWRPLMGGMALAAVLLGAALLWWDREPAVDSAALPPATPQLLERGRVLALAGNCAACHTARGGAPYAGGRAIGTPFGTVYAGNLTPDPATGIGRWTAGHFWRALQHGRGFDGQRLVPVFPYTETTRITRADSDALFAWLRTVPAVQQANREHALRWPYGSQPALAVWRALFFRPGPWQDDPAQSAAWNRGAYLVNGPGHCVACHGGRNVLGGTASSSFGGGMIPQRNWYAPAFSRPGQASVADWPLDDIVALLRDGHSPRGRAIGPMAEVVARSTQHLPAQDLQAMAVYLKSLPVERDAAPEPLRDPADTARRVALGAALYTDHCAACHGAQGEGGQLASGLRVVPPLAGNRTVTQDPPANLVRAIAQGGFGPVTAANPRPFGMPPYAHVLSDAQIAEVATFLRRSWGAQAAPLAAADVARWRSGSDE